MPDIFEVPSTILLEKLVGLLSKVAIRIEEASKGGHITDTRSGVCSLLLAPVESLPTANCTTVFCTSFQKVLHNTTESNPSYLS